MPPNGWRESGRACLNEVARCDSELRHEEVSCPGRRNPPKIVFGLVGGLVATLTCVTLTIEGNAYSQKPHSVPIAVIGLGPEVAQLASRLQRGGAFRVIDSPPEAIGLALVQRRKADAIVNLDTHQLQTAQVASTLTPSCWRQIFSSPTSSLHLTATDIRPYGTGIPRRSACSSSPRMGRGHRRTIPQSPICFRPGMTRMASRSWRLASSSLTSRNASRSCQTREGSSSPTSSTRSHPTSRSAVTPG